MKKGDKYIVEISNILKVTDFYGETYEVAQIKDLPGNGVLDEYDLSYLQKYEEPKEKEEEKADTKYLDCYFVVTAIGYLGVSDDIMNVGEILHVKDGKFITRDGSIFPLYRELTSRADLIDYMDQDFAGVKIAILQNYKEET